MNISVFMSTYNGEKYLREQIDSILNQRDVDIELWIRDDGSRDNTINILHEYKTKFENVHICRGKPVGVGRSFMGMLFESKAVSDYYAFADQDDIWDKDKLSFAVSQLHEYGSVPALYVCNQRCVAADGTFLYNRFPDDFQKQQFYNILFANYYAGCTMVFDNVLKELLCDRKRRPEIDFFQHRIHDAWVASVASLAGILIFDPECHMSFRRHDSNVTDARVRRNKQIGIREYVDIYGRKVRRRIHKKNNLNNGVQLTAENLLNGYDEFVNSKDRDLLMMVSGYRKSIKKRMQLLFGATINHAVPESKWNIRMKIILNIL